MYKYQRKYKFDNGYGASVVCGPGSYGNEDGLFEMAILDKNGDICYDTPIADGVLGYLDFEDVVRYLEKIESLEKVTN